MEVTFITDIDFRESRLFLRKCIRMHFTRASLRNHAVGPETLLALTLKLRK